MLQPKTITIDGTEYILGHWDVKKALETWAWLLQTLGEGVSEFFSLLQKSKGTGDKQSKDDAEFVAQAFGLVVSTLRKNIPSEEYARRMMDFCSDVAGPNGKLKPPYIEFQGNTFNMHRLVVEVLAFQYADFLEEALSLFKE